jgi:hypothetical protein
MSDCEFWEKVGLTVLDKGLLALIVLVAGFYLNKVLEAFKGKLSREQEFTRSANAAVVELTRKLATGSHLISWLSWNATEPEASIAAQDFAVYDKGMIDVLSDLVGLQASVAALDPVRFAVLSNFAEQLYVRDISMGKARALYCSTDPEKIKQANVLLQSLYHESLEFDKTLLTAVTGLLAPAADK